MNVQEWGRFLNWWRHADNVQGGGGAPGVPPIQVQTPPPPTWLAGYGPGISMVGTNMAALGKTVMFIKEVLEESAENAVVTRMPVPLVVLLANNKRRTVPKVNNFAEETIPKYTDKDFRFDFRNQHVDAT